MPLALRKHSFLGMTQSLCPDCLQNADSRQRPGSDAHADFVVPAKVIERDGRVYFRKTCPIHGVREDFVCSDVRRFDRNEYATPGKLPLQFGVQPKRGCPYDCGLCDEHEQHTCIALLEITANCNLTCPMCFAASAPGGSHVPLESCRFAIDQLVRREGKPEVLQLSGGEPTIHPDFIDILRYAHGQPIDVVMINTNGIKLATDDRLLDAVAELNDRVEVYFQFDGFRDQDHRLLRGASLCETKFRALERLSAAGIKTTLVTTLQTDVNLDQAGEVVRLGLERDHVTGVSFQPSVFSGRYFLPDELERRITFPDVVDAVGQQVPEVFSPDDFLPLPCAHPNGHVLAYAFRDFDSSGNRRATPLNRFIDLAGNMDLLANGIVFTRQRAHALIQRYVARASCGDGDCLSPMSRSTGVDSDTMDDQLRDAAMNFFKAAASESLSQADLLRITVTSFMDPYNFDLRQLMKSCVHHLLPSGHLIPFSAYNVLYREGHVPLPPLHDGSKPQRNTVAVAEASPQLVTLNAR